ncbi:hypothetical protein [Sporosarcina globispora]|nr:hypothetical protein [Sporosarcina globispora]
MTYIMVDKNKFIGFVLSTKFLSRDMENIKDDIQSAGKRLDWEVLASANVENTLKTITRSMDEQAALLNKMSTFLANALRDYNELDKELFAKWENGNAKVKKSFLEVTEFDLTAPFGVPNIFGTAFNFMKLRETLIKVLGGYKVIRDIDGNVTFLEKVKLQDGNGNPNKKTVKVQTVSGDTIKSEMEKGNYVKGAELVSPKAAALAAVKDRLGLLSMGIDVVVDIGKNIYEEKPVSKIIGDTLGNIGVGVGVTALAGALTIATLPASAPIAAVATVGFGVSVGLTYLTEGVKWNVDLDNDDEDDSIKDMIKAGFSNTIAGGWFK